MLSSLKSSHLAQDTGSLWHTGFFSSLWYLRLVYVLYVHGNLIQVWFCCKHTLLLTLQLLLFLPMLCNVVLQWHKPGSSMLPGFLSKGVTSVRCKTEMVVCRRV